MTNAVHIELVVDAQPAAAGVEQFAAAMRKAEQFRERELRGYDAARQASLKQAQALDELRARMDPLSLAAQRMTAANDNLSRSSGAAQSSFHAAAIEVATTAGHLKAAALAAYALSPAFRGMVNPIILTTLAAIGPAAVSAAGTLVSALMPALAFLSRIAMPVLAIAVAWQGLNQIINLGSGLLEKYGNAQRNLIAGVDENLTKLTRFQDDGLTAQQVQYATELGERLTVAKRTISDFWQVQLNLTDPALKLQAVWVGIVEVIASGVDKVNNLLGLLGRIPGGLDALLKIASGLPGVGLPFMAMRGVSAAAGPVPEVSEADALAAARRRLAAGLGSSANFAVRFGQAINDLQNPPKLDADQVDTVKKTASEFDRLARSLERTAAGYEGEAAAAGKSIGERERLRAESRLLEAAQQDGIAINSEYAARIKEVSSRLGEAAEMAAARTAQERAGFDLQTVFLSGIDRQIAQVQRQLHGNAWKAFMDDGLSAAVRLTAALKSLKQQKAADGVDARAREPATNKEEDDERSARAQAA